VGGFAFYVGECVDSYGHGHAVAFYDRGEIRYGTFDRDSAKEYVVVKHHDDEKRTERVFQKCKNELKLGQDGVRESKRIAQR
jgi:hypothetical protein